MYVLCHCCRYMTCLYFIPGCLKGVGGPKLGEGWTFQDYVTSWSWCVCRVAVAKSTTSTARTARTGIMPPENPQTSNTPRMVTVKRGNRWQHVTDHICREYEHLTGDSRHHDSDIVGGMLFAVSTNKLQYARIDRVTR